MWYGGNERPRNVRKLRSKRSLESSNLVDG